MNERNREALWLIGHGYARFLLVPAYGEFFRVAEGDTLQLVATEPPLLKRKVGIVDNGLLGRIFEETHVEMLEARRMLEQYGLKTAILVSSPYHSRRIKLISRKVFGDARHSITCVPTRFQPSFSAADWLDPDGRKKIVSEYLKLGWFLAYSPFYR